MTRLAPVGWATYVQEVRYVAGAWMRRSDRCPPLSNTEQPVGNKLPTLREHDELF